MACARACAIRRFHRWTPHALHHLTAGTVTNSPLENLEVTLSRWWPPRVECRASPWCSTAGLPTGHGPRAVRDARIRRQPVRAAWLLRLPCRLAAAPTVSPGYGAYRVG